MKPLQEVAEILVSYKPTVSANPLIKCSQDAYQELNDFFPEELISLQEMFVVMYMNNANRIIGVYRMSVGGIVGTVADPRLILATALKVAATSIIISHNHPSCNLKPSTADINLTKKLKDAGSFMDISLTDHIIISPEHGKYYSFMDEGMI
jgi:DNA repair protein RadC